MDTSSDNLNEPDLVGPLSSKRWAFQIVPRACESFSSWILRVLRGNYVSPTPFLRENFNVDLGRVDLDLAGNMSLTRYFSECMGIPVAKISSLAANVPSFLFEGVDPEFIKIMWTSHPKGNARCTNGPRFCPVCLATDPEPYFRARWRLGFVTACQEHRCMLENKCPRCNSALHPHLLNWTDSLTCCYRCGYDLSDSDPDFLESHDKNPDPDPFNTSYRNSGFNRVKMIYHIARFLLRFCPLTDPIFPRLPITTTARFNKIWEELNRGMGHVPALQQPLVMHYLIGIIDPLLENPRALERFLLSHHSSLASIWTNHPISHDF